MILYKKCPFSLHGEMDISLFMCYDNSIWQKLFTYSFCS